MSKYNKIFRKRKARVSHTCNSCGQIIVPGDFYYSEEPKDKFLHFLHAKKFCEKCYERKN